MADASIPVNLFNPGQVFACLGFLEAADVLLGDAKGGFDWSNEADVRFRLRAGAQSDPFGTVLEFLAHAIVTELAPISWPGEVDDEKARTDCFPSRLARHKNDKGEWTTTAFPVRLARGSTALALSHWADGSDRNDFKLYSGNRSAAKIAQDMLLGTRGKPKKGQSQGDAKTYGLSYLWTKQRTKLTQQPFDVLTSVGGSFNFDPRGTWTGIDAGYSPNDQGHGLAASPVVEILSAIGLEHARPQEYEFRRFRYGAWGEILPPILARPALAGANLAVPMRQFVFELALSGKNKIITFAQEENSL